MCPLDLEIPLIKEAGALYTANEIAGQPELWLKIYRQILEDRERISSYLTEALPKVSKIILTGAGTSAYIGLSLHGIFNRSLHVHTDAVATTDLVSHPGDYFLTMIPLCWYHLPVQEIVRRVLQSLILRINYVKNVSI
ncbi:MAG: hypothetical protein IPJ37_13645 [Bacteroidales bacterium]|nr:hypothetical protein [Bacteroidales bacterium]